MTINSRYCAMRTDDGHSSGETPEARMSATFCQPETRELTTGGAKYQDHSLAGHSEQMGKSIINYQVSSMLMLF